MYKIKGVLEYDNLIIDYLIKRRLLIQYKKVKNKIISWNNRDLKLREHKKNKIYYFRINKQFRALWRINNGYLIVYKIDNHQNT
jgi:plasmid maintenance system killer protein